jgi:CBS domain-containing protein
MFEAVNLLHSERVGCLPVVEKGELVGIITTTDMLALLIRLIQEKETKPGGAPHAS